MTALISGFTPSTLNPTGTGGAGWSQITSIVQNGQDATHLAVIENGLMRVVMDLNVSGNSALVVYAFNGSTWKEVMRGGDTTATFGKPTITTMLVNHSREIRLQFNYDYNSTGVYRTRELVLLRGMPFVLFNAIDAQASVTQTLSPNKGLTASAQAKTILFGGATTQASDKFGMAFTTPIAVGSLDNFYLFPNQPDAIDILYGVAQLGTLNQAQSQGSPLVNSVQISSLLPFWIGGLPRTYALGDATPSGNTDGQFREGEDNFTAVTGTWATTAVAGTSNGNVVRDSALALNHEVKWNMNFPFAGRWLIGIKDNVDNATGCTIDMSVATVFSGSPKAPTATAFTSQSSHQLFGPFTVAAAGNAFVSVKVTALGSATRMDVDFIALYAYQSTASTPVGSPPAKDIAQSMLRQVSPQ